MASETVKAQVPHNVIMQNREKLSVSGVQDVENFDDRDIVVYTTCGKLTIHGSELRIDRLSVEDGDLTVNGMVDTLEYSADAGGRAGLLSKLFG